MDIEIWKSIDGYDGKYQVSNLGRVKSIFTTYATKNGLRKKYRDVMLKPMVQKNGYLYVCLWSENKKKNCLIHRLVAQAFVPNPYQHPEVNHKDENKSNNNASNLEWCTTKENVNYGTCIQRISQSLINHPCKSKNVYQYSKNGVFIKMWISASEIERQLGYLRTVICRCCRGVSKTAYGFVWSYNPKENLN